MKVVPKHDLIFTEGFPDMMSTKKRAKYIIIACFFIITSIFIRCYQTGALVNAVLNGEQPNWDIPLYLCDVNTRVSKIKFVQRRNFPFSQMYKHGESTKPFQEGISELFFSDNRSFPLLSVAIISKSKLLLPLLNAGARLETKDDLGATPLMYAAATGSVEAVRILVNFGADVNATEDTGTNVLTWAYFRSDDPRQRDETIQVMKILLINGADPHKKNHSGQSVIDVIQKIEPCKRFKHDLLNTLAR